MQALLDNRLFWVGFIRSRWLDPAGFQVGGWHGWGGGCMGGWMAQRGWHVHALTTHSTNQPSPTSQRNMRSFGASLHDATGLPWAGVWVLMTYLRKRYWTQMAEQVGGWVVLVVRGGAGALAWA